MKNSFKLIYRVLMAVIPISSTGLFLVAVAVEPLIRYLNISTLQSKAIVAILILCITLAPFLYAAIEYGDIGNLIRMETNDTETNNKLCKEARQQDTQ